ncbi:MAG: NUDIX domain-containing protein [Myxococcota bacterium]
MVEGSKGPRLRTVPQGDTHERLVCPDCGFIAYENPKVIAGSVVTREDRFLLCRRAIEPRAGFWTLPAGFLELGESPREGAAREAWEEAYARIDIDALLAVYTIRHIGQIQLMFRAHLADPDVAPGPESTDVQFYRWEDIPWAELAFPSVHWALEHFRQVQGQPLFAPFTNPPGA